MPGGLLICFEEDSTTIERLSSKNATKCTVGLATNDFDYFIHCPSVKFAIRYDKKWQSALHFVTMHSCQAVIEMSEYDGNVANLEQVEKITLYRGV